jgi:hypothetical protein
MVRGEHKDLSALLVQNEAKSSYNKAKEEQSAIIE